MDIPEEEQAAKVKRQAIQAIMRDTSLSSSEKQAAIQKFMASGGGGGSSRSSSSSQSSTAVVATSDDNTVTLTSVGEDNQTTTADAGDVGTASVVTTVTDAATAASATTHAAVSNRSDNDDGDNQTVSTAITNSSSVGAVASTGPDTIVQRKLSSSSVRRTTSLTSPGVAGGMAQVRAENEQSSLSTAGGGGGVNVDGSTTTRPVVRAGSVASTGADPAARKGRPSSRPSTVSNTADTTNSANDSSLVSRPSIATTNTTSSGSGSNRNRRAGASSSSAANDPALRKGTRSSSRSTSSSVTGTATVPPTAQNETVQQQAEDEHQSIAGSSVAAATATTAGAVVASTAAAAAAATTVPTESVEERSTLQGNETIQTDQGVNGDVAVSGGTSNSPAVMGYEQQETYAGLSYNPAEIAGGEEGGIQAYVAGQDDAEVIDAVGVVTDTQLKQEEDQTKRKILLRGIAVFVVLLIVIIVVPVVVVQGNKNQEPVGPPIEVNITDAPTMAPSSSPTSSTYFELVTALEGLYSAGGDDNSDLFAEAFGDPSSPQSQAATWAADIAPVPGLAGDDPRMISRYSLAALYFATNGDGWKRCGRQSTQCGTSEEWLTAEDECNWYAVECVEDPTNDDHTVQRIFFPSNNGDSNDMVGTLPLDVSFLSGLESFVVANEVISGPFPDWSQLTSLQSIIMNRLSLTGTVPAYLLEQNPLLGTIQFSTNSMSGLFPTFSPSTSLVDLRLDNNNFTGPIGADIGNLPTLRTLYIDNNALTSTLPNELYNLVELRNVRLSNNVDLTGGIDSGIGNLSNLLRLQIANTTVGNALPTELYGLSELQDLDLSGSAFIGPLSDLFSQLVNLGTLRLNNNQFNGPIPSSSLAAIPLLETITLESNDLTGVISSDSALCGRRGEGFGNIKVLSTDCDGNPPQVLCDCCTSCGSG